MRIAQVSPLIESVPPVRYGAQERIIFYLTEELVSLGHDVSLFASADSISNAHLIPGSARALKHDIDTVDVLGIHMNMLRNVADRSSEFDIIHFHTGNLHYALTRYIKTPYVTTLHDRMDNPENDFYYRKYSGIPVVAVSNSQRKYMPNNNWQATVYPGIPENQYDYSVRHAGYLAYVGRASADKGILAAIEIAQRADMKLKIAARIDKADEGYFNDAVKPLLTDPRIEFLGEINNTEKNILLGDACALLSPGYRPGPSGLAMIESMACGTPVIAFRSGSAEEIIQHGVTGYVVDDINSAVETIQQVELLSRKKCRETFAQRFTSRRMAHDYIKTYRSCIENRQSDKVSGQKVTA